MLIKEFSHTISDKNLTAISLHNSSSHKNVLKKTEIRVGADSNYYVLSCNVDNTNNNSNKKLNNPPKPTSEYVKKINDSHSSSNKKSTHFTFPFDQTLLQTKIISRYVETICKKYTNIEEKDVDFDISTVYKNDQLWLTYTFKFPKLQANDYVNTDDFIKYKGMSDEFTVTIKEITLSSYNKIKIYVSSIEINSIDEMQRAINKNKCKEISYQKNLKIKVTRNNAILITARSCKPILLNNIQQDVQIDKIILDFEDYNNDTTSISLKLGSAQSISQQIKSYEKGFALSYFYTSDLQIPFEIIINSLNTESYKCLLQNNLYCSIYAACISENESLIEDNYKNWQRILKIKLQLNDDSEIENLQFSNLLSDYTKDGVYSIKLTDSLLNYLIGYVFNTGIKSTTLLYIKPVIESDDTVFYNNNQNILLFDYTWTDVYSMWSEMGSNPSYNTGNRLVIDVSTNIHVKVKEGNVLQVPQKMEYAYIYNTNNSIDILSDVPNLIIPSNQSSILSRYLSSTAGVSYNGYCDNNFNIRTMWCKDGIIYKDGNISSDPISFTIDYISYYVDDYDSDYPDSFYLQELIVKDNSGNEINMSNSYNVIEYSTGNSVYDIKRKAFTINNFTVSDLTKLQIVSQVYKIYYNVVDGIPVIKDENNEWTTEGTYELPPEDEPIDPSTGPEPDNRFAARVIFNRSGDMEITKTSDNINLDDVFLPNSVLKFVDENDVELVKYNESLNINQAIYNSVDANKFYLIKYKNSSNNSAIQNVIPSEVDHINVVVKETSTFLGRLDITGIKNIEDSEPLIKFGLLSDVHFDADDDYSPASEYNFDNAIHYFNNNEIYQIYINGDLTVSQNYEASSAGTDLEDFRSKLVELLSINDGIGENANNYTNIYITRGNHDVGCIYDIINYSSDPTDPYPAADTPDRETKWTPEEDDNYLYKIDNDWTIRTAYPLRYVITDSPANSEYIDKIDAVLWDYNYYSPYNASETYVNAETEQYCNSYNSYALKNSNNETVLNLIVISLPLYSNSFWNWNNGKTPVPAYSNEQISKLEDLIRENYKQENTEIMVITHLPFDNGTGNYKNQYQPTAMRGWYDQGQYACLKAIHDSYTGVIWIEGHTHFKYEMQCENVTIPSYDGPSYYNNANVSCINDVFDVHIPSCAYPRYIDYDLSVKDNYEESEGAVFEIYSNHIIIKGISFKKQDNFTNNIIPTAIYRLNFIPNSNKQSIPNKILNYDPYENTLTINQNNVPDPITPEPESETAVPIYYDGDESTLINNTEYRPILVANGNTEWLNEVTSYYTNAGTGFAVTPEYVTGYTGVVPINPTPVDE